MKLQASITAAAAASQRLVVLEETAVFYAKVSGLGLCLGREFLSAFPDVLGGFCRKQACFKVKLGLYSYSLRLVHEVHLDQGTNIHHGALAHHTCFDYAQLRRINK